jgi:hypothetical protein
VGAPETRTIFMKQKIQLKYESAPSNLDHALSRAHSADAQRPAGFAGAMKKTTLHPRQAGAREEAALDWII